MIFLIYSFFSVCCDILLGLSLFRNLSGSAISKNKFGWIIVVGIFNIFFEYIFRNHRFETIFNIFLFLLINVFVAKCFEISFKKGVKYISLYFLVSTISESVIIYLLSRIFVIDNSQDIFLLVGAFITSIAKVVFVMIAIRGSQKSDSNDINLPSNIFRSILIIPFLSAFILVSILYLDYYYIDFSTEVVCIILVAMFILNIALFTIFNEINRYYENYVSTLRILNTIENKINHYQDLEKSIEDIRLIKHDLKNSMIIVLGLLQSGNEVQAIKYLNDLVETTESMNFVFYTKNKVLNYLLNSKIDFAQKNKINVSTNVLISEQINLENNILSVILGNILDNAINACIEMDSNDKRIDIKIKVYQEKLMIFVENTYDSKIKNYLKTKSNGLGLKSVKRLVEQKHGLYEVNMNDNRYAVTILLFNIM